MAPRGKKNKKGGALKVNFKNVESRQTPAEGDYLMEVTDATAETANSGGDMIKFTAEVVEGKFKGAKAFLYCPLAETSLWKLAAFLGALGEEVPEDELEIELPELIGKQFIGVLTHEKYNGRNVAKLTDFSSVEDYDGEGAEDEEEDDKSSKGKKGAKADKGGKKSKKTKDEPEGLTREAAEGMDREEIEEWVGEHELEDFDPDDHKKDKKLVAAFIEALEEADLLIEESSDEDDEEEGEEDTKKGAKGKKGAKKNSKVRTYDRDEVTDMDEDELEEVLEAAGIDLDISGIKKLGKKVEKVLKALETKKLLND
jgi:hypothetical protein